MMTDPRIQQFRQMAESDPNNELGHFSLGRALLEAGDYDDAAASLKRAIDINPRMSKGYQLLGEALDRAKRHEEAVAAATRGVEVATQQGDRMPRDAMIEMLKRWNAPVPEVASKASEQDASARDESGFQCARCGKPGGKLPKPPIRGALGEKIFQHTCSSCWQEWIPMGTKVINELGLTMNSPQGASAYDQYMVEFLQLEEV